MARGNKTVASTGGSVGGQEVTEQPKAAGGQLVPSIGVASADEMAELDGVIGAGVSDNADDRGVPLLAIAHKAGPQLDKKQDKYIEGLEFGDVFNNISKKFYKTESEPLIVLPCFYRMVWKRWTPRDAGGGFKGTFPRDTQLLRGAKPFVHPETNKERRDIFVLPDGDELHQTADYYCVLEETWQQVIVPMASTNLGSSRTLQTLLEEQKIQIGEGASTQIVTKPAFWSRVALKTTYQDSGDFQWYNYSPSIAGENVNVALRRFCKAFALAAIRNEVKISEPEPEMVNISQNDKADDIPV